MTLPEKRALFPPEKSLKRVSFRPSLYAHLGFCIHIQTKERTDENNNEELDGGNRVRAGHRDGIGQIMFKRLRLAANVVKPIKVVLTPQEWAAIILIFHGTKPYWSSIAQWADPRPEAQRRRLDSWDFVLKDLGRAPDLSVRFFTIMPIVDIALVVQHERYVTFMSMFADPVCTEQDKQDLRKTEVILASIEQKLKAIVMAKAPEFWPWLP
jgi:hypothetical protein